jgi:NADPH:quinone reductase-like Zn-dependent oxidoreductase
MKAIVATKYGPPDVLQLREVEKPTSNNPLPVPGREQGDATVSTKRSPVHQDTMMAIVQDTYGSPDVLELRDIDRPEIGDDQVLVRVHAAGVNPADWAIVGGLPYIARPVYGLRKPKNAVRGTDVAGTVEAVGAGVTRFRPGDEVFGWCGGLGGAFAEYAAVSEDALALKPANLTFEQAAAVPWPGSSPSRPFAITAAFGPGRGS